MSGAGRPSDYTPDLAADICSLIAEGNSLRKICEADEMPDKSTVFRWLAKEATFRDQYARAQEDRTAAMAEDLLEIADANMSDIRIVDGKVVFDGDVIQRAKLRVDTRKWLMSKMSPKKYGDKVTQEVSGPDGGPVETITRIELVAPIVDSEA